VFALGVSSKQIWRHEAFSGAPNLGLLG